MCALYLHHALFSPEPSPLPTHSRQMSSLSAFTIRTSTSDSHPTEPLLTPGYGESSAYLDLLSRQPQHPDSPRRTDALDLASEPPSERERRSKWESRIRKRIQRLRWTRRVLSAVIGSWAIYNTARYFDAFSIYPTHPRQTLCLVLGTITATCTALLIAYYIFSFFVPHIGWSRRPDSWVIQVQSSLRWAASSLVLAPAIVNVALVGIWRHTAGVDGVQGRCKWEADVVWSGIGGECAEHGVPWAWWLVGALVRVGLTMAVIGAYHLASYKYAVTRRPSRRRHRSSASWSASYPSSTATRSIRTLVGHPVHAHSQSTLSSTQAHTQESASMSGHVTTMERTLHSGAERTLQVDRMLRRSHSRLGSDGGNAATSSLHAQTRSESPDSSDDEDRYGTQVQRPTLAAARSFLLDKPRLSFASQTPNPSGSVSVGSSGSAISTGGLSGTRAASAPQDLSTPEAFLARLQEIQRETEAGIRLAQNDPGALSYAHIAEFNDSGARGQRESISLLGRVIHRMPTIESLGSQPTSPTSSSARRSVSRPPTRANTTRSRDSKASLAAREGSFSSEIAVGGAATVNELGEVVPGDKTSSTGGSGGSGETGRTSWHTALAEASAEGDEDEAAS